MMASIPVVPAMSFESNKSHLGGVLQANNIHMTAGSEAWAP